ncbi:RraA family protein [Halotalea alkalilenta]|uniref:RraA family protein n=1 Tax=Halotalea alkalilenta TaxID=376489 RepID=UPI000481ADB8|nr:RraA family protein [Halotalea alkalilenta]
MSYRIAPRRQGMGEESIRRYQGIGSSTIGHLNSQGYLRGIEALFDDLHMVGNVVTAKVFPPDGSVLREALLSSRPGDVLVIECVGDDYACWGELRTMAGLIKGLAGVVVAGPVTDARALRRLRLPVFCQGVSAVTTRKIGLSGEVNGAIEIAGVDVAPGDLAVGDDDGVFILGPSLAEALLPELLAKEAQDQASRAKFASRLAERDGPGAKR